MAVSTPCPSKPWNATHCEIQPLKNTLGYQCRVTDIEVSFEEVMAMTYRYHTVLQKY